MLTPLARESTNLIVLPACRVIPAFADSPFSPVAMGDFTRPTLSPRRMPEGFNHTGVSARPTPLEPPINTR